MERSCQVGAVFLWWIEQKCLLGLLRLINSIDPTTMQTYHVNNVITSKRSLHSCCLPPPVLSFPPEWL